MPLDRAALKRRAKETIKTSRPSILSAALIVLVLSIIINTLSARLMGINISQNEMQAYMNHFMNGNYDAALSLVEKMKPSGKAQIIDLLLTVVNIVMQAGFVIFLLNSIRSTQPCFGNLLDGFGFFWKIILLNLLIAIFIILWSLLLVFPGIIAAYRYSQALYILVDDPSKSPLQCLRESKAMMHGHKMELFRLNLSFLGWYLLASLPTIGYGVQAWTLPYTSTTYALYYEQLAYGSLGYEEPVYTY